MMTFNRSRLVRAADGGAGGGAPAGGEPPPLSGGRGSGGNLTAGDRAAEAANAPAGGSALPDGFIAMEKRPEWLPEKFYDAEKKLARVTDLAKAFGEAEKKVFTRTDDLRRQLEREIEENRVKGRPEKPDGYQMKLPDGFKIEGLDFQPDEANPMVQWWRNTAHSLGLKQEQFEEGVKAYVESLAHDAPDIEAEMKALGDNGPQRLAKLEQYLSTTIGQDAWAALKPLATSAPIILALEKLADAKMLGTSPPQGGKPADTGDTRTREDLRVMMADPRYRDPFRRDPAFIREVEALQKRLYAG